MLLFFFSTADENFTKEDRNSSVPALVESQYKPWIISLLTILTIIITILSPLITAITVFFVRAFDEWKPIGHLGFEESWSEMTGVGGKPRPFFDSLIVDDLAHLVIAPPSILSKIQTIPHIFIETSAKINMTVYFSIHIYFMYVHMYQMQTIPLHILHCITYLSRFYI